MMRSKLLAGILLLAGCICSGQFAIAQETGKKKDSFEVWRDAGR